MPADEYAPLRACLHARKIWELVGRPGDQPQLELFEAHRFAQPERVQGEKKDRPRRRGRKRASQR